MVEEINVCLRDNVEIEEEQWNKLLSDDLEEEKIRKSPVWRDFDAAFISSYFGGRGILFSLNGHTYKIRKKYVYDSVEELRDDILSEWSWPNKQGIIVDLLEKLTKEELLTLFTKSDKLRFENDKIILKESD